LDRVRHNIAQLPCPHVFHVSFCDVCAFAESIGWIADEKDRRGSRTEGGLVKTRTAGREGEFCVFEAPSGIIFRKRPSVAGHHFFYRSMTEEEFRRLGVKGFFATGFLEPPSNGYGGITQNLDYVQKHHTGNNTVKTHIVEFAVPVAIDLERRLCDVGIRPKNEHWGFSWGLGNKNPKGSIGRELFNILLREGVITCREVFARRPSDSGSESV
jgi:hypothetical protein